MKFYTRNSTYNRNADKTFSRLHVWNDSLAYLIEQSYCNSLLSIFHHMIDKLPMIWDKKKSCKKEDSWWGSLGPTVRTPVVIRLISTTTKKKNLHDHWIVEHWWLFLWSSNMFHGEGVKYNSLVELSCCLRGWRFTRNFGWYETSRFSLTEGQIYSWECRER